MISRGSDLDVPRLLACEVERRDGARVALGDIVGGRAALLVFVRHFACPGCSHFMEVLAPRLPELAELGVSVAIVGSGSPARLAAFVDRMHLDARGVECLTDPSRGAYRAAGLRQSALGTYGPKPFFASLGLYAMGHWVRRHEDDGDVEQQGGIVLLDGDGRVVAHHRDRDLVDHAPVTDVVHAALELAAARVPGGI